MQRFAEQDTTEMNVGICRKSVKNPPQIAGKSTQNCSWEAVGELLDSVLSSPCDSEAFGVLQGGQRELLGPPWGGLGTPLRPTRGALGSFWAPFLHLWKAFGVPQSRKTDFLKIIVFLMKTQIFDAQALPDRPRNAPKSLLQRP